MRSGGRERELPPLAPLTRPTKIPGNRNARLTPSNNSKGVTVRCLIVDDNRRFLDAARGRLEHQGLLVVGVASNGSEAVQLAQELRPDVTLLDIDLGEENGFEVARQLQGHDAPIILISTHAEQDYRDLIAESSVLGFLAKADLSAAGILDLLGGR